MVALPKTATAQDIVDAASKSGVRRVPAVLASLLLPAVVDTSPAAVPTMRVAILQERGNAAGGVDIRMDLPPRLNTIEPLGSDPVAAFGAALALSGTAAAAEATSFDASAFSSLAGRPLTFLPADTRAPWDTFINALPTAQQPAWEAVLNTTFYGATLHALVPTGGTTAAFWIVDSTTGAATAVLLDGSGGALTDSANCTLWDGYVAEMLNLLNALLAIYTLACLIAASAFFCVGEVTKALYLTAALLLAVVGGLHTGGWLGLAGGVAGVVSAFLPFGGAMPEQVQKIVVTSGLFYLGRNEACDEPTPTPAPPTDSPGTYVRPIPECPVEGSLGGACY